MEESPSPSCTIGRCGGDRFISCRSSPKTPSHPSNGYAVMDDDGECNRGSNGVGLDPTSSSIQISSSSVRGESYGLDMHNDVKSTTLGNNNLCASQHITLKSTNQNTSPSQDYSSSDITAAISNEDGDDEYVVVSQEVVQPSSLFPQDSTDDLFATSDNKIGDTPSKTKRNGRKSTTSDTKSRRRSLRIQERALATPEKNNNAGAATAFMSEPITIEDELNTEMLVQGDDSNANFACKRSSRRSSIRILARKLNSPSPAVAADNNSNKKKKSQTKRRYSQSGRKASPKRRNKDEGKKLTSRNSQKPQGVDNNDGMMLLPPKQLMPDGKNKKIEDKAASRLNGSTPPSSVEIGISENGHGILTQALEKIVRDVIESPLSGLDNASKRNPKPSGSKKHGDSRCGTTSVLESLDDVASKGITLSSSPSRTTMEHDASISSTTKRARPQNRRDTFHLYKGRGLTSAARAMDLNVLIDDEVSNNNTANEDYVTPKAGGTEVNIDAMQKLNDEPKEDNQNNTNQHGEDTEEYAAVKNNLSNLTSNTIKRRMEQLVPDKIMQINKYPCVSARIFAAMSFVYADQANLTPLLPLLTSLIDAEIVSLQNKEENEVCFISKKVCFSGFDYSSTTTAVGEVVGQGGGDLCPSIKALETVLQQALNLPRPAHYLDIAIQCLHCMSSCDDVSDACAKTMIGYFPSPRFGKALKHYMNELKDIKRYVLSQISAAQDCSDDHMGVRYRLNDFIGRSVRFHLRELLNTIPKNVVDFNVDDCAERWGRAVDDRSISSILNYSLEKINELQTVRPELFEYGVQNMPDFFKREASIRVDSMSRDELTNMDKSTYESLLLDIKDSCTFLVGARSCKFALSLLQFPEVEKHVASAGGWGPVEAIASTFYKLNLHEESENCHFAQLREVRDLVFMLEEVVSRFEKAVEDCEKCMRRLRRKFIFKTNSTYVHNLKVHLAGEKEEHFPLVIKP